MLLRGDSNAGSPRLQYRISIGELRGVLTVNGPMTRSDRAATLEEAKAQFQKSWDAWKEWAKLPLDALPRFGGAILKNFPLQPHASPPHVSGFKE